MQLVLLAAGFGTRFGGLKQLAPVGPNDEAIMDYTASYAHACGFESAVVVIRNDIEADMRDHIAKFWPKDLPVDYVYQPSTRGTAPAVFAAGKYVTGPFAVANADDLYGDEAMQLFPEHFSRKGDVADPRHLLIAYRLVNTVLASTKVKRGLCELNDDGELQRIAEHEITVGNDHSFTAVPFQQAANIAETTPRVLSGAECVSMNLWGFHDSIFGHLEHALAEHVAHGDQDNELLLPEVIQQLVATNGETVRVVVTEASCIGITSRDDLAIVRSQVTEADDKNLPSVSQPNR